MAALDLGEGYRVWISAPRNKRSASKRTVLKNVIWNTPPTLMPRRARGAKMAENLAGTGTVLQHAAAAHKASEVRTPHMSAVSESAPAVRVWMSEAFGSAAAGGGGETQSLEGGRHLRSTAQPFLKRRMEFNLISYELCTFPFGTAGGRKEKRLPVTTVSCANSCAIKFNVAF